MPLLNHTTTVAVDKTVAEIGRILSAHGARRITTDYDGRGNPTAVSFAIATPIGDREFRLPCNEEGVWRTLTRQYNQGKVRRQLAIREQAARVSWRIVKDWMEAQVAIIEAGIAPSPHYPITSFSATTPPPALTPCTTRAMLHLVVACPRLFVVMP